MRFLRLREGSRGGGMRLIETENCLHKLVEEKSLKRKESETRPIGKTNIICKQKEREREGERRGGTPRGNFGVN